MKGRYDGRLVVQFMEDGRRMRLEHDFGFVDAKGTRWDVPGKAIVDGASIPRFLWSLIGGPFEGRYRDASVIHDWYCDLRSRPWLEVHRMFHEAILASGVGLAMARLLYAGVYLGGPRWNETTSANVGLLLQEALERSRKLDSTDWRMHFPRAPGDEMPDGGSEHPRMAGAFAFEAGEGDLPRLREIASEETSLEEIEARLDALVRGRPATPLPPPAGKHR